MLQPAGVGIGRQPPVYLKSGDEITVSVTGLGTLTNRVADSSSLNPIVTQVQSITHLPADSRTRGTSLTTINNKPLNYKHIGDPNGSPIVFVHGLGSSLESFRPLIHSLGLERTRSLHLFDLEGHGLSPTSPLSKLSVNSFAADLNGVFESANITSGATIVAHSIGCLVAVAFALKHPGKVSKIVLVGPPPSPLPPPGIAAVFARAELARAEGMAAVVDAVAARGTSQKTKTSDPLAMTAIRISLLGTDTEGYAKACWALAEASALDFGAIQAEVLIVTGSEDQMSSPDLCKGYVEKMGWRAGLEVLQGVGYWHLFEDPEGLKDAVGGFLS